MVHVSLPIREYADKIVKAVQANPVTIIIGETGSGKTTQIAQVRLELLLFANSRSVLVKCG